MTAGVYRVADAQTTPMSGGPRQYPHLSASPQWLPTASQLVAYRGGNKGGTRRNAVSPSRVLVLLLLIVAHHSLFVAFYSIAF